MALTHPADLEAWRRWQEGQKPLRRLKNRLRPAAPASPLTLEAPEGADVLVVHDSWSPTSDLALSAPSEYLDPARVAHLHPGGRSVSSAPAQVVPGDHGVPASLAAVRVVVALGHYQQARDLALSWAQQLGARFITVQHGLLAPAMAPLAPDTTLLSWTDEDAEFWMSGRADVEHVTVGSQLLWRAAQRPAELADDRPVFLGQLHGAELPRRGLARASREFCRAMDATYRPHPAEKDKLSRLQHRLWERAGIEIDRSGQPLSELDRPVASVFSTGVLEAAARGLPAWVHYDGPPAWLSEFWERYGMSRWGRDHHSTQPRGIPEAEPARRIAALIEEMAST